MTLFIKLHKWQTTRDNSYFPYSYAQDNKTLLQCGTLEATFSQNGTYTIAPGYAVKSPNVVEFAGQFEVTTPDDTAMAAGNIYVVLTNPLQGDYSNSQGGIYTPDSSGGSFSYYEDGETIPVMHWGTAVGKGVFSCALTLLTTETITANSPIYPTVDGTFSITPPFTNCPSYGIIQTTPVTTVSEDQIIYVDVIPCFPAAYVAEAIIDKKKITDKKS